MSVSQGVPTGKLRSVPIQFDHTFGAADDNQTVYGVVGKSVVNHCLSGGQATLIAFGQTGSGKTHTQRFLQEAACKDLIKSVQVPFKKYYSHIASM